MKTPEGKPKAVRKRAKKTSPKDVQKTSPKELVDKAIENIGNKLETDEVKGSYSDLIRLLQLKKEMDTEEPREVEVKWIEEESSE